MSSISDEDEASLAGFEKPFESCGGNSFSRPVRSGRFEMQAFVSKLMGWPAIVICGHLIIQVAGWSFFAAVQSRGFIALPPQAAGWVTSHLVHWICTLISTILAGLSSFLFSWGVSKSISLHMHRDGMSLGALISILKTLSRSPVLNRRKQKWSAISVVLILLLSVQTSGWSALITPTTLVVSTPLTGSEIDLSSPLLTQMLSDGALDDCVKNASTLAGLISGQTDSGYAAAKGALGIPAALTVIDQTFDMRTGGILPLSLTDVDLRSWFYGILPKSLYPIGDLPSGPPLGYETSQQGFTADVTCRSQEITANTTPSAVLLNQTMNNGNAGNMTYSHLSSDCGGTAIVTTNSTFAYTIAEDSNYVLMVACPAGENYTLIFMTGGIYSVQQNIVCTFVPQITRMDGSVTESAGGPAGLAAVITIFAMVRVSQSLYASPMGDQLLELAEQLASTARVMLMISQEEYIRGVAEYSGTIFRTCLSTTNAVWPAGVPANMTLLTEGNFTTNIAGWASASASTFWVLLPGTIIALITVFIVLKAIAETSGDSTGHPFDPSNPMHLLAASASGGLHDLFTGSGKNIEEAEDARIILTSTPDQLPALVRMTR
ncbi:hypothetical protein DFH07DRAFT_959655 [Mycena maculata]|uniref:Transmembrane protein n=1 Tax=Mycena maculata TaxID=230809 RepID=A0AAD7J0S5_9AGAR|nr:hypothetical protein DFH07DRAFT_959655 [Mycena maculata]